MAPIPRPVGDADPVVLPSHARTIVPIIRAYDSFIVRLYCLLRFRILRGRFLEEINQFLPAEGNVFEVGCGFGLFGLYFGRVSPHLVIRGVGLRTPA